MERPLRLVIAGGGTGGHVLPAVSVLEELRRREIPLDTLWIGSKDGVEREAAQREGVPFQAVSTGKLRRYLDARTVPDAFRVPVGIVQARRRLARFRPEVVFSTGGFVSVPSVLASRGIAPVLSHEQTTILGLATRINMRATDVLAVSFEETRSRVGPFKGKVVVTGNPVRASIFGGDAQRARARFGLDPGLPLVYVTGGARGASPLNKRIEALLPELLDHIAIVHQAGPARANDDAAGLAQLRATWPPERQRRYSVHEFIGEELADLYAAAMLVIGRAGAGTVAELAALGLPSILIPLPLSGGGEQVTNAHFLESAGAAIVIPQSEATPGRLRAAIIDLVSNPDRLTAMRDAARAVGRPDAAERLADELLDLAGRASTAPSL